MRIEDLCEGRGISKSVRAPLQFGSAEHVTPRSQSSRGSSTTENAGSEVWDSASVLPCQSAAWSSPTTPRSPFERSKHTLRSSDYSQTINITPPPLSRYNRYGHDLHLDLSPRMSHFSNEACDINSQAIATSNEDWPQSERSAVELAGSLLLPSQGFPQSNPPTRPPHANERSHSAPTGLKLARPLSVVTGSIDDPKVLHASRFNMTRFPPSSKSTNPGMKGHHSTTSLSCPQTKSNLDDLKVLSQEEANAGAKSINGRCAPPPTPLSQMSLEKLMEILPTLDAAIIAQDWLPLVLKRHKELKFILQTTQPSLNQAESLRAINMVRGTTLKQLHTS